MVFRERGLLRLDRFLPAEKVERARKEILDAMGQRGGWRDGDWHLDELPESMRRGGVSSLGKRLRRSPAFRDLVTPRLIDAFEALLDGQVVGPLLGAPDLLLTWPNAARWAVPSSHWHLDMPRVPGDAIPGIQLFGFLAPVAPGGGGTLAVAGSHRLLDIAERFPSREVTRLLRREPYFRDLLSKRFVDRERFIREPDRVGNVEVQVIEMHGRPGDVILMDMRVLHAVAPNATRVPRLMFTLRFVRPAVQREVYQVDP
jgi:ectoine hydroxylase-related dioxygenase (phytanoyl-CoA dioxygenase family)